DVCQGGVCTGSANPDGCADDFLCYKVKNGTAFVLIPGVNLGDQFEASQSYQIKRVSGSTAFVKRHVKVQNQLLVQPLFLDVLKPDLLYVPTLKSLTTPPPSGPAPNNVNHYKCYRTK